MPSVCQYCESQPETTSINAGLAIAGPGKCWNVVTLTRGKGSVPAAGARQQGHDRAFDVAFDFAFDFGQRRGVGFLSGRAGGRRILFVARPFRNSCWEC